MRLLLNVGKVDRKSMRYAVHQRSFYKRHPALSKRTSEHIDRGRINMGNDERSMSTLNY